MTSPMLPPDIEQLSPREQVEALAEAMRPKLRALGLEAYCDSAVWLRNVELRKAIEDQEPLILSWRDGTTSLHYALSLAMLEKVPTPKAQRGAQFYRHQLKANFRVEN